MLSILYLINFFIIINLVDSLKFLSEYSLFSSFLLPLLWRKPPLFLASLEQQPYNLKICSRCCQCSAVSLDAHYSQICQRFVTANTCNSLPEGFLQPVETAEFVPWTDKGVNSARSSSRSLADGTWWIDTDRKLNCALYGLPEVTCGFKTFSCL